MSILVINKNYNFLNICYCNDCICTYAISLLFKQDKRPIYFLLLVGIIIGTFLGSITTFLQVLIDPNEFTSLQNKMFASFNNVNGDLVWFALVIIVFSMLYGWRTIRELDVLS